MKLTPSGKVRKVSKTVRDLIAEYSGKRQTLDQWRRDHRAHMATRCNTLNPKNTNRQYTPRYRDGDPGRG